MTREEMILKAKEAKSAEEIFAIAKENGMGMTEEGAKAYYEQLHKTGELDDDELDNVAGGRCYNDGRPVVSATERRNCFRCSCGDGGFHKCPRMGGAIRSDYCGECKWCVYENGLWLCTNPANCK